MKSLKEIKKTKALTTDKLNKVKGGKSETNIVVVDIIFQ